MTPKKALQALRSVAFIVALMSTLTEPVRPARAAASSLQLHSSLLRLEKTATAEAVRQESLETEPTLAEIPAPQAFSLAPAAPAALTCAAAIRIMPLGDSITKGSSSGTPYSGDPTKDDPYYISYRRDLWNSLKTKKYDIDFVGSQYFGSYYLDPAKNEQVWGFDPYNEGHGGWTDGQVAANIHSWLDLNPADVVLLHIGTNVVSEDESAVEQILNEINLFEEDHSTVWVFVARIIKRSCEGDPVCDDANTTTVAFNNNVQNMVVGRPDYNTEVFMVDMETGAGINYQRSSSGGDMWDDKHPYKTGYAKMATKWEDKLNDILPFCARDDGETVSEDYGSVTINVFDNDGGTKISLGTGPSKSTQGGTVAPAGDGKSFIYTPPANFYGLDSFNYSLNHDPAYPPPANSDLTATVAITVNAVNDPPVAVDDTVDAIEDTPLDIQKGDLIANDSSGPPNESDQILSVVDVISGPNTHGTVSVSSNAVTYVPEANYFGTASFEYKICDVGTSCDLGTVNITISAMNDLPTISAVSSQTTLEDAPKGPIALTIGDVETTANNLLLTASSTDPAVVPVANIVFGGTGSSRTVTVTPASNRNTDSKGVTITLTVKDGDGGETSTSFKLVITPVDDAPVVTNPGDQVFNIGETVSIQIQADDPDLPPGEEKFTYEASGLPQELEIDAVEGLITGTIASGREFFVEVIVHSGSKIGTTSFKIIVGRYRIYLPNLIDRMSFGR